MNRELVPAAALLESAAAYEIYRHCMYHPTPEKYAARVPALRRGLCFACLQEGELAGILALAPGADGTAEIVGIAVAAALRGQGIGAWMLRQAVRAARLRRLTAETDGDAVGFYRSCGFATAPVRREFPEGPALRYRCELDTETSDERWDGRMFESVTYSQDKTEMYALLGEQLRALVEGERDAVANLANASALLADALADVNWAGFYLMRGGELVLGPFQGKPACIRIPVGKGVCGTAAARRETQLVADVHAFPGHIACDSASNSEIVVPLFAAGAVVGVLDIDSPELARFDAADRAGLEAFARILEAACDWAALAR